MHLEVPDLRPAVFTQETAAHLEAYLAFRHRFRNLYLFDLDPMQVWPLVRAAPTTFGQAASDIERFCEVLTRLARELD
jgi:hypothetical protein